MSQPAIAKPHPLTSEIESVGHPPSGAALPIVIPSNQYFSSRQIRSYCIPACARSDKYVSQMNNSVFSFDRSAPVTNQQLREIFRTIAVSGDFAVIKMRVRDEIKFHSISPLKSPSDDVFSLLLCASLFHRLGVCNPVTLVATCGTRPVMSSVFAPDTLLVFGYKLNEFVHANRRFFPQSFLRTFLGY